MKNVFNKIGAVFNRVWESIKPRGANGHRQNAYERYLGEAVDVHDLEARERAWSRRMQHRNLY